MTLHYVTGSAKIYNGGNANGSVLSTNLFSEQGTYLGYNELNGAVPGCDEYAGQVVYTIQTETTKPSKSGFNKTIVISLAVTFVVCLAIIVCVIVKNRKN